MLGSCPDWIAAAGLGAAAATFQTLGVAQRGGQARRIGVQRQQSRCPGVNRWKGGTGCGGCSCLQHCCCCCQKGQRWVRSSCGKSFQDTGGMAGHHVADHPCRCAGCSAKALAIASPVESAAAQGQDRQGQRLCRCFPAVLYSWRSDLHIKTMVPFAGRHADTAFLAAWNRLWSLLQASSKPRFCTRACCALKQARPTAEGSSPDNVLHASFSILQSARCICLHRTALHVCCKACSVAAGEARFCSRARQKCHHFCHRHVVAAGAAMMSNTAWLPIYP